MLVRKVVSAQRELSLGLGIEPNESYAGTGEASKTVMIVSSDVAGSTSLGERLARPRGAPARDDATSPNARVLERHGGTLEKFIGDAVMAVFGIAAAHEDDALRAVRAAAEVREALARLD